MNYQEAIEFIHAADWKGSVLGLERITDLMHRLGDPQNNLKFIHIAGTNGKGSTSIMLSSILTAAGLKTGLNTSPHLVKYNERIKINGQDISDEDLIGAAEEVRDAVSQMEDIPTEFERFTAISFVYFAKVMCDIVVLEVGLGGRLDSTNVINAPEVAVITNLGLEHTEVLGDTIEKIAFEKSGIIKKGCDVVLYHQSPEAEAVVKSKAFECGSDITITNPDEQKLVSCDLFGQTIDYRSRKSLLLNLIGVYQYYNCAVVLDTVDALIKRGFQISEEAVMEGLKAVKWPARFEVLSRKPLVLLDGAHNPNGVEALEDCVKTFLPGQKITFAFGVMADKDYRLMINTIKPYAHSFIAMGPEYYRALSSDKLAEAIKEETGLPVTDAGSVENGVRIAFKEAEKRPVVIFGSLYQVSEVYEALAK